MKRMVVVTWMLCLALLLIPLQTQAQSRKQGISLFEEAVQLHARAQSYEDLKRAVEKYEKALRIFKKTRWTRGAGGATNNLGMIYARWGQYDKAVSYYSKSLAIARELKHRRGEEKTLTNLGNVYYLWGRNDKAVSYYKKSLAISKELKDRRGEGKTLNNLGSGLL